MQGILFVLIAAAGVQVGSAWAGWLRLLTTAIGSVLMLAGSILAVRGVVDLRAAFTPLPRPRDGARLVDSGAYRLVRHPIYGGIVLAAVGWGLVTASLQAIVLAGALLGLFRLKSAREEAWLSEAYPAYDGYARGTRRFIPFVY